MTIGKGSRIGGEGRGNQGGGGGGGGGVGLGRGVESGRGREGEGRLGPMGQAIGFQMFLSPARPGSLTSQRPKERDQLWPKA